MHRFRIANTICWALASAAACCFGAQAESPAPGRCQLLKDGIEYRSYLPDGHRYVYVAVKIMPGVYPTVIVIADKNYDSEATTPVSAQPYNAWWLDRSRPMVFSSDKVVIRWDASGTFDFVTDWFRNPPPDKVEQPFRGLTASGGKFSGTGDKDTNSFAFQNRLQVDHFTGDVFEVSIPTVSFDGVTIAPPVVRFERGDDGLKAKC